MGNNIEQPYKDYFGFLPLKEEIIFKEGKISPAADFDKAQKWIDKYANKDGYLYPSMSYEMTGSFKPGLPPTDENIILKKVPKTKRPTHLDKVIYSHSIEIDKPIENDARSYDASFIVHLLGYLYGVRLQFHDWLLDGKISVKLYNDHHIKVSKKDAEKFISDSYEVWKKWPSEIKKMLINILYMNARAPMYEWLWEQFLISYMIFDACFKVTKEIFKDKLKKPSSHGDRLNILCDHFKIKKSDEIFKKISELRNDLFHEALWNKEKPCSAISGDSIYLTFELRKLNNRLIPAILGNDLSYISSDWTSQSPKNFKFDKKD